MNRLYEELSESEDVQELIEEEEMDDEETITERSFTHGVHYEIFQRVLCIEILASIIEHPSNEILRNIDKRLEEDDIRSEYEFEVANIDRINHSSSEDHIFSQFPKSFEEYLNEYVDRIYNVSEEEYREHGILLPISGSITVSDNFDEITISVPNDFEIRIRIRFRHAGNSLPMEYPQVENYPIEGYNPADPDYEEYRASSAHLIVEYNSTYPEQSFEDYRLSHIYHDEIKNSFSYSHDWEDFIDNLPHERIFDIQKRVKDIESKIEDKLD